MGSVSEEITVYVQDVETYLDPEEYQKFLKAKEEVDAYREKKGEYDKKKAEAERLRDECEKKRDEAKSDDERRLWDAERSKYASKALVSSPPYYSVHYFHEHDRYIDLVRERKVEEERRKEKEKKRRDALECIDPPLDDAKRYLSDQEYQQFRGSLLGAADGFLTKGRGYLYGDWRLHEKALPYAVFVKKIEERKEEEVRQKQAKVEHNQFIKEINDSVKKIKQELAKVKKPNFAYPPALAKYKPNEWSEMELPTEGQVKQWAEPYVRKRVPPALKPFASWNLDWQVQLLPYAKYELLGVPCLTWCFRVVVLVKVHLRLMEKAFVKEFRGWEYEMKVEPEELGYFHLGPVEWDDQEAFSSPIPLLCMLAEGKLEDDGIEVFKHDGSSIRFWVRGYDEGTTEIDERFRQFVMDVTTDKTLAQGLLATGMLDEITAQLVEEKAKLPLPQLVGAGASPEKTIDGSDDVVDALEVMGFKGMEIKAGIEAAHLSPGMTLEEKITAALKNMVG